MNARRLIRTAGPLAVLLALANPARSLEHSGQQLGTWTLADSPHFVLDDVLVPAGASLVIEAGAEVYFWPDTGLDVLGELHVEGRDGRGVLFASARLPPGPGDWRGLAASADSLLSLGSLELRDAIVGLRVEDGAEVRAQGCRLSGNLDAGALVDAGAAAEFRACRFEDNGAEGLRVDGAKPLVEGCVFNGNETALALAGGASPRLSDCRARANSNVDGILVDAAIPVRGVVEWDGGGLPYVLDDGATLSIEPDGLLLLQPGCVVKLGLGTRIEVGGVLMTLGEPGRRCVLTSLSDDEILGDTNRDDTGSSPSPGDWSRVDVLPGGSVTLHRTELRYGIDGLRVQREAEASVLSAELHRASGCGLAFEAGALGVVADSFIHDNETGLMVSEASGLAVGIAVEVGGRDGGSNTFSCNAGFDVVNLDTTMLPALGNFWGQTPPSPAQVSGPVDQGAAEVQANDAASGERSLRIERAGVDDLLLLWAEASSCSQYHLRSSTRASEVFGAESSPTAGESLLLPAGAASDGEPLRFYQLDTRL